MESQIIIRDDTYGQYIELETDILKSGKIILSRSRDGYMVSQTDLENYDKWSPFTTIVKVETFQPKDRSRSMDVYEETVECISTKYEFPMNCLCLCVGLGVAGVSCAAALYSNIYSKI